MSDTPRTNSQSGWGMTYRGKSASTELYVDPNGPFVHSQFARQLERELNAANERIELLAACNADVARIANERDDALKRIKRLEEAGNQLKDRYILENENWDLKTVNDWNEAKESKP